MGNNPEKPSKTVEVPVMVANTKEEFDILNGSCLIESVKGHAYNIQIDKKL